MWVLVNNSVSVSPPQSLQGPDTSAIADVVGIQRQLCSLINLPQIQICSKKLGLFILKSLGDKKYRYQ